MSFPEQLEALKAERKVNNSDIERGTGLSNSLVGSYCRGVKEPTITNLSKLAGFFDVSVDYLIGRSDERKSVSGLSSQEVALLGLFRDLPDDAHRDMVYGQVKAAAEALSDGSPSAGSEGERKKENLA